jgi:hypothetical protein
VTFLRWLSIKSFRGEPADSTDPASINARPKKRRRTAVVPDAGYKKEFDVPPPRVSQRPPKSTKSKPFKSMIAEWWLDSHPEVKPLEGGEWLVDFCNRLKDDELHSTDRGYLKELIEWHEKKARGDSESDVGEWDDMVDSQGAGEGAGGGEGAMGSGSGGAGVSGNEEVVRSRSGGGGTGGGERAAAAGPLEGPSSRIA